MIAVPYLRPTVTQRLRAFLVDHQDAVSPWSTAGQVLDQLYGLLYERREDPRFWRDLTTLVDDMRADLMRGTLDGLAAADAEVFAEHQVSDLIDELRQALRRTDPPRPGLMAELMAGRSAGLLACVTLLATAVSTGCAQQAGGNAAPSSERASASTPLTTANQDSAVPADASVDSLVDLFRDGSPDQIATRLEALIDAGAKASADASKPPVQSNNVKPKPQPYVPRPVVRYKGVTF